MGDKETSRRARARWKLLYKTLKGCSAQELNADENSTRSFPGYELFDIKKLSIGDTNAKDQTNSTVSWFSYTLPKLPQCLSIKISILGNSTQATDLIGFDNTGNVCVWPSEEVLAYYCVRNAELFKGKSVVELGCGMTGLAGIFIAANTQCRKMMLTDGNEKSVENLTSIVTENKHCFSASGAEVSSAVLRWGEKVSCFTYEHGKFDVVICADCLFFVNVQSQLIDTIKEILRPDGKCIIFAPRRSGTLDKFVGLARQVFDVKIEEDSDQHIAHLHHASFSNELYSEDLHFPILVLLSHIS